MVFGYRALKEILFNSGLGVFDQLIFLFSERAGMFYACFTFGQVSGMKEIIFRGIGPPLRHLPGQRSL